jgi:hypothetical protein
MEYTILNELISPWSAHWNEEYKMYYYYDPEKKESVWELPVEK